MGRDAERVARAIKKRKDGTERKAKIAIVQKAVLYSLAAAGGLTMALVAPNALLVLEQFGWVKKRRSYTDTVNKSLERLIRHGLARRDAGGFVELTKRGERRLAEIERANYKLPLPAHWDGKWRLLSFDIKEKRKHIRELLRRTLSTVGFVRLHKSFWVYPHDCEEFISLLKADYHVGVEVLYIVADYLENDGWLRRRFGLI
jgi:DNA-binding transcriptional regulator PaaX